MLFRRLDRLRRILDTHTVWEPAGPGNLWQHGTMTWAMQHWPLTSQRQLKEPWGPVIKKKKKKKETGTFPWDP